MQPRAFDGHGLRLGETWRSMLPMLPII